MKAKSRVIIGYIFILLGIFLPLLAFTSMSYREIWQIRIMLLLRPRTVK